MVPFYILELFSFTKGCISLGHYVLFFSDFDPKNIVPVKFLKVSYRQIILLNTRNDKHIHVIFLIIIHVNVDPHVVNDKKC